MASSATELFSVPVPPCESYPGGAIVCTSPAPDVYLLTITSPPDNRLTTALCGALLTALDVVEFSYPPGVLVTTSGIAKFYSNGLDLDHAQEVEAFCDKSLYALWARLLTYPMPTVALLNGHAFAGGLMTAMFHDYRVMNGTRGFACLNELDFGAALRAPMSSIFREKVPGATYRGLVLEARRFAGPAALEAGIVDALGGLDEALALAEARGLAAKGKTGVYGMMKAEMYRETLGYLGDHEGNEARFGKVVAADDERVNAARERVEAMAKEGKIKAKL